MILFLGDSFTWGQGLQYYHLVQNEGWDWNDCKNFLENNTRFEKLGFEADEFRRKNSFPYLVAKELNLPLINPRFQNGGDNYNIYDLLDILHLYTTNTSIDKVVIQFTAPTRRVEMDKEFDTIENLLKKQIYKISKKCEEYGLDWYAFSWYKELGDILKSDYSKNYIPIIYNDVEYECFDFMYYTELQELTIQFTKNIDDGHFNLEGHKVIANSIINKLKLHE